MYTLIFPMVGFKAAELDTA